MQVITVVPIAKNGFKEHLTYFHSKSIEEGTIVNIQIRSSTVKAVVVNSTDASKIKSSLKKTSFSLKKIKSIVGPSSISSVFIKTVNQMEDRFCSSFGKILNSFSSTAQRENILLKEKKNKIKKEDTDNREKFIFQAPQEERIIFYKTYARELFAKKQSIYLIVPTNKEVERIEENLKKGIEDHTVYLHGQMKKREFKEAMLKITTNDHPLLIITTPYLLSYIRKDTSCFIIEKEHSSLYKQIKSPFFDARVFIEALAYNQNATIIRADTVLQTETLGRHENGDFREKKPLLFRQDFSRLEQKIIDTNRKESLENSKKQKPWTIFKEETIEEIKDALEKNQKIFLFTIRKGFSGSVVCSNCESLVSCDNCFAPMILSKNKKRTDTIFLCPRCKKEETSLNTCKICNNWNLVPLGIGIESIYKEAQKLFPNTNILLLDGDILKTDNQKNSFIKKWSEEGGSIIIGNESILPLIEQKAFLSIIVSMETLFSIPDFRITDRIIHLLYEIQRSATDKIIIQTKNPEDRILSKEVLRGSYLSIYKEEIEERKKWHYPPFSRIIKIKWEGKKTESTKIKNILSILLEPYKAQIITEEKKDTSLIIYILRIPIKEWSLPSETKEGKLNENLLSVLKKIPQKVEIIMDPENMFN